MNTNILKDIKHDLIEKKLWVPALILAVLIVVVPMSLAKPSGDANSAVPAPPGVVDDSGPQLALTRASTTGFARPPRVNDKRLDPFASRASSTAIKDAADKLSSAADDIIDSNGGGTNPPNIDPTPSPEPSTPEPDTEPEVQTETDDLLSILVTDVAATEAEPKQISDIRTLSPLVDPEDPFLVYVGKTSDDRASFLVSADVTVSGDGECSPSPTDCRTLTLAIGKTAEFTLVANQSQKTAITVLDIETKAVPIDDAAAASSSPDDSAVQARLARQAGAKALKSVLGDDEVVKALAKQKIKIRH